MTIKAVFFDMGGTIETFKYTKKLRLERTHGLHSLLISAGIDLGLNNQQLFEIVTSGLKDYHDWSLISLTELKSEKVWRDYIFKDFSIDNKVMASISEDLMFYIETRFYKREMRPEIPSVLEEIKKMDLKIGLISNVNSRRQVPFNLKAYKINQYFDPVVLSSEFGRRKPDPAIFQYATRLANVPTSECIYIGDRISRDIVGAHRAGFRLAVQIQHDFNHGEQDLGSKPDVKIKKMTEVIKIIEKELSYTNKVNCPGHREESSVRAILFDAGDILYYRKNRNSRLHEFLKNLSLDTDAVSSEAGKLLKKKAYNGDINREQYQEALLKLYGVTSAKMIEQGRQILEYEDNNITIFDGVCKTLLQLKAHGYYLGIITDTAASTQMKMNWFENGGFGHVWDTFISSKELGVQKPNPKIYRAALKQLRINAGQAIFVGHDADELNGAKAVGMKTVAFNYKADTKADYYIEHFVDLLQLKELKQNIQIEG